MKKNFSFWLFSMFLFCHSSSSGQQQSQLKKIIIIRHAEKPAQGDNLSCKGWNRALQLSEMLPKKVGTPDYIFVPTINTGKSTSTARMYQTIVPLAVKYNLSINTKYDVNDTKDLVQDILKRSGIVLIVWEHKHIDNIIKAIGIQNVSKWPEDDFDLMWVIDFQNGKPMLTKDKEGINPFASCK